jgi:hypothetical protein
VLPAYGGSWEAAEADLLADPHEARLLGELTAELAANGIQRPVSVFFEHWWKTTLTVDDGMHRAIAAMRLGVGIPIGLNYQPADAAEPTDVYRVTAAGIGVEGLLLAVLSLASFRSADGAWIQADNASGRGDHAVELYLPHHRHRRRTIAAELQDRLQGAGITAEVRFLERRN